VAPRRPPSAFTTALTTANWQLPENCQLPGNLWEGRQRPLIGMIDRPSWIADGAGAPTPEFTTAWQRTACSSPKSRASAADLATAEIRLFIDQDGSLRWPWGCGPVLAPT
jgi:hypothetical protein